MIYLGLLDEIKPWGKKNIIAHLIHTCVRMRRILLKGVNMATQTTQGTGHGSAERHSKGPDGGNRINVVGPTVIAAGHCTTEDPGTGSNWRILVEFPTALPFGPHEYVVMTQQDDYGNGDGRNQYPAHVEKLDAMLNNEDDGYTGGFGGFILHTGDSEQRRFMWTVIKTGFNG